MALKCERNFLDFTLICHYRLHTDYTIRYIYRYLKDFHNTKQIFLKFRAYNKTKAEPTKVGSLVWTELSNLDSPFWQQVIMAAGI